MGHVSAPKTSHAVVGPNEGRELELMVAGVKPLSMFVEPIEPEFEYFPGEEFDRMASEGRLIKNASVETVKGVRRDKAAFSSGCKAHPETAPARSNRSSHGGNELAEAFG